MKSPEQKSPESNTSTGVKEYYQKCLDSAKKVGLEALVSVKLPPGMALSAAIGIIEHQFDKRKSEFDQEITASYIKKIKTITEEGFGLIYNKGDKLTPEEVKSWLNNKLK